MLALRTKSGVLINLITRESYVLIVGTYFNRVRKNWLGSPKPEIFDVNEVVPRSSLT